MLMSYTEKLIQTLKEQGYEMGYDGSTWYSLAEIEKISKKIEENPLTNQSKYDIIIIQKNERK